MWILHSSFKFQLLAYHKKFYTLDRMALVGVGVSHEDLVAEGKSFTLGKGQNLSTEKSVYHGGQSVMG